MFIWWKVIRNHSLMEEHSLPVLERNSFQACATMFKYGMG